MKVLITGGAGFIGSHLADELVSKGCQVTALDDMTTGSFENINHLLDKNENFKLVVGTILDKSLMDKLVERCDVVFHLAAVVGVELVLKEPLLSLTTNIKGSEIVFEMAYRYHKKILLTSTSEIYGKNTNGPLKEEDDRILGSPMKSRWSYSTSKAVDEILAYYYWKEKELPTISVRLFNIVGPRQTGRYGMVIPRFISQALKNEAITVFGNGKQSRCFLHVDDAVRAMIALMEKPDLENRLFNIGSQEEITIKNLALKIVKMTNSKSELIYIPYKEAYEEGFEDMLKRIPDIERVKKAINFTPTMKLEKVIQDIVNANMREEIAKA